MHTLRDENQRQARQKQAASPQAYPVNPEIDARLTAFMAENPKLVHSYSDMPKEHLIRKLCLHRMYAAERKQAFKQQIHEWVGARPEIKAKIEERLSAIKPEDRPRAFISMAKSAMQQIALRVG